MSGKGRYLKLAPGQKCLRCGADNSYRPVGTKWCYACSKELDRIASRARREYHKTLRFRDERGYMNACCHVYKAHDCRFCGTCGQRLQGQGGYRLCEEEF